METTKICPMCGGENEADAIFCANDRCHKALGEFKYVREEMGASTQWHESLAEKATGFIGKPYFVLVHVGWFAVWVLANSGIVAMVQRFDTYPYSLLGLILAIEAIFIAGFVLISQNRQNAHADKRAELDYEVSVRTYREILHLEQSLHVLTERLERLEANLLNAQSPGIDHNSTSGEAKVN